MEERPEGGDEGEEVNVSVCVCEGKEVLRSVCSDVNAIYRHLTELPTASQ